VSDLEDALVFQIGVIKLPPPVLEHRFHPTRKWRFDLAWPDKLLACEVEGGTWINGAHSRGAHFESDCEKYDEAVILGWRVLRVTNHMVEDGRAVAFIERMLEVTQ
jgi:very-short-patch-repair endonuclease